MYVLDKSVLNKYLLEFNNVSFVTSGIDYITKFGLLLEGKHVLEKFLGYFYKDFFFVWIFWK